MNMSTLSMHSELPGLFIGYSVRRLELVSKNVEECLTKLSDGQVWHRHAHHENAIGNLILHICGNIRQLILHGIGNAPDDRVRDSEFSARGGLSATQLLSLFQRTVVEANQFLSTLPPEYLTRPIDSKKLGNMTVLETIYRVVGHTQQHLGQIIVLTKQMYERPLSLSVPTSR
jgi:uncharacterized damage-inducible protein DinB